MVDITIVNGSWWGLEANKHHWGAPSCCLSLSAEACGARPPKPYMSEPFAPWQINGPHRIYGVQHEPRISWMGSYLTAPAWRWSIPSCMAMGFMPRRPSKKARWWSLPPVFCWWTLRCLAWLTGFDPTDFRHHPISFLQDWLNHPQVAKRRPGWAAC